MNRNVEEGKFGWKISLDGSQGGGQQIIEPMSKEAGPQMCYILPGCSDAVFLSSSVWKAQHGLNSTPDVVIAGLSYVFQWIGLQPTVA